LAILRKSLFSNLQSEFGLISKTHPRLFFEPLPQDDPKQRCPDISKAKRLLGWEPKVGLDEGLRTTLDYFKEHFAGKQTTIA